MPLYFCHPQAPHKKLRVPEWYISSLMLDRALDAVVRRIKHLDREHDIPYLAGYSKDGKTNRDYRPSPDPDDNVAHRQSNFRGHLSGKVVFRAERLGHVVYELAAGKHFRNRLGGT